MERADSETSAQSLDGTPGKPSKLTEIRQAFGIANSEVHCFHCRCLVLLQRSLTAPISAIVLAPSASFCQSDLRQYDICRNSKVFGARHNCLAISIDPSALHRATWQYA